MRTMVVGGGIRHEMPCVSHMDNYEVLLIRVSHWLWRWYRADGRPKYLESAIQAMAGVKYQYREPVRNSREASGERMRAFHARKQAR